MSRPGLFVEEPALRPDGLYLIPRKEFVRERFDYEPGEHVVFGGPTTGGKTTLAFDLLTEVATPECPAFVCVSKPHDDTTSRRGAALGFRRVTTWPPPKTLAHALRLEKGPRGYLVWPKFGDIDRDEDNASVLMEKVIKDRYAAGVRREHGILVMDDTMVKSKLLGLDRHMTTILAMGKAMGLGEWVFVQKPTDSGRTAIWSFSQCEHLFLTNDPDRKSRQRYDEIGGVDPKIVSEAVQSLGKYQFLYIKRTGPFLCVVDR